MTCIRRALFLALIAFAGSAGAEGYAGFKLGVMQFDVPIDDATSIGIYGGSNKGSGASFEGEFTHTIAGGEARFGGDITLTTFAGYAAFRSAGDVYFKGKVGALFERAEFFGNSDTDTGVSGGLGIGFRSDSGNMFEIEYTIIEEDANYFSLGLLF